MGIRLAKVQAVGRVAIGLRAHSGWAVLVAVGGPHSAPVVVDRKRLSLCDGSFPRQPYHAAEALQAARAAALVERSLETANRLAREAVAAAVEERLAARQEIVGAGLLLGSGQALPAELPAILGSHPLIHTAEGVLYREALRAACEHARVPVVGLREREIEKMAGERLKLGSASLRARLAALGKPLGPPWTQDEKLSALAAWLVLTEATN